MTTICELKESSNKGIRKIASYSCNPKEALVCFIMQDIRKDFNTWKYPEIIPGMRESKIKKDHWYFDDINGKRVLGSYPC